jgi:hypothetical protein
MATSPSSRGRPASALAALAVALACFGNEASAKPPKQHRKRPRTVVEDDWAKSPAAKYAALQRDACLRELRSRGIAFTEVPEARGVLAPIRLRGPLGGVTYRTEAPAAEREKSPFEVFDCRLALALDDFGAILRAHDVEEALIFSAWRPPPKSWPATKLATRHPGALAVDIRVFVKKAAPGSERPTLVVERDWLPAHEAPSCGDKAPPILPDTAEAREIRDIFCQASDRRIFSSMLGPNYDKPHKNHFHLEVTPGVKWRLSL